MLIPLAFAVLSSSPGQIDVPVRAEPHALTLVASMELPRVEGSIGHLVYRPYMPSLFVPARDNGTVEFLGLTFKTVEEPWTWPAAPHSAAFIPGIDHVAVTDAKHGYLMILDAVFACSTGKHTTLADKPCGGSIGEDAGCIRYLQKRQCLLVGWGAGALAWVEVDESKQPFSNRSFDGKFTVLSTIALGGHPEAFQFDAAEQRAWVNVPSTHAIAVVDLDTKTVARTIELKELANNYPMALAESEQRLLIGCRDPGKLLVLDTETDALVAELPLSNDVDDLFVDEDRGLVYASSGAGHVDVFERAGPGAWKPKEKLATGVGARTCWFDRDTKQLFVAVPHLGEQKAEVLIFSTDETPPKSALKLETVIPMPGVKGRIDHMALDPYPGVLFVAAPENGTIELLDLRKLAVMSTFAAPAEPRGAAYIDGLDSVVVTDGKEDTLWLGSIGAAGDYRSRPRRGLVGSAADDVRYLWKSEMLLVGHGAGGLSFVDVHGFELRHTIELGAHPESFQVNAAETRAWVSVPDEHAVAVVDLRAQAVARWIGVNSAEKICALALAEKNQSLLVGCGGPAKLLVFDIETDRPTDELPLSGDVDDIFVDEARGLVYAACGEGFVDVFERAGPSSWYRMERVATAPGARTCLFAAAQEKLFVAVPRRGDQRSEIRVYSTKP